MSTYESDSPPPPRRRPPPRPERRRKSQWPWIVVVVLLLLSIGLGVAGAARIAPTVQELSKDGGKGLESRLPEPLLFPGTRTVDLEEVGTWRIYHEYTSMVEGRAVDSLGAEIEVSLRSVATGQEVALSPLTMESESYDLPHRSATVIRKFEVDQPGQYEITARRTDGGDGEFVLTVGKSVLMKLFGGMLPGIGLFVIAGALFLASVVVGIIQLVRRG